MVVIIVLLIFCHPGDLWGGGGGGLDDGNLQLLKCQKFLEYSINRSHMRSYTVYLFYSAILFSLKNEK